MNAAAGPDALSKNDLNLFPELSGPSSVSDVNMGLPFDEDDVLDVTDNEDLMSYMNNGRDKTSSIGSTSPRDASDIFDEHETVSPSSVENVKPPVLKVVRIVRLPGKTGAVTLVDKVDRRMVEESSESQSMSKNAIAARENRQKKKMYISGLEQSVEKLNTENRALRSENEKMVKSVASLEAEVRYLKRVLANQSTLSGLLRNIGATQGVQFRSSLCGDADDEDDVEVCDKKPVKRFCRKRKFVTDNKEQARKENVAHNLRLVESMNQSKKRKDDHCYVPDNEADYSSDSETGETGGICLHVNKRNVSIEFCAMCSTKASGKPEKTQFQLTRHCYSMRGLRVKMV